METNKEKIKLEQENIKELINEIYNRYQTDLAEYVLKNICDKNHEILFTDRENRWNEYKEFKRGVLMWQEKYDIKYSHLKDKLDAKFDKIYMGVIATLSTTVATLLIMILNYLISQK